MKPFNFSLHCNTCGKDVFKNKGDYFMLKNKVWQEVCANDYVSQYYVLCKDCTEKFLGRKLTKDDYADFWNPDEDLRCDGAKK